MKFKNSDPADFSAGDHGKISGYFATFDHDRADSYGDVIRKGAFLRTINERKKTGHPFPLCFNHDFSVIIGKVTDIGEDERGAYFTAKFFPTEKAQEIRNIVKSGVLWQFSFAYDVIDRGTVTLRDGSTANELRDLDLYEISIVAVPANPRATITDVKTDRNNPELTKEQVAARDKALKIIAEYESDKKAERDKLLVYINGTSKEREHAKRMWKLLDDINDHNVSKITDNDLFEVKEYLKKMEGSALHDIGRYEVEGDLQGKEGRMKALAAIRLCLNEIDRIMSNRKLV